MNCSSHNILCPADKPYLIGPDNYGIKVDIEFVVKPDPDGKLDEAEYQDFLDQLKRGMARIVFVGKHEGNGTKTVAVALIFEDFTARRKRGWLSSCVRKLLGS
jgi:hypothetical protein